MLEDSRWRGDIGKANMTGLLLKAIELGDMILRVGDKRFGQTPRDILC